MNLTFLFGTEKDPLSWDCLLLRVSELALWLLRIKFKARLNPVRLFLTLPIRLPNSVALCELPHYSPPFDHVSSSCLLPVAAIHSHLRFSLLVKFFLVTPSLLLAFVFARSCPMRRRPRSPWARRVVLGEAILVAARAPECLGAALVPNDRRRHAAFAASVGTILD